MVRPGIVATAVVTVTLFASPAPAQIEPQRSHEVSTQALKAARLSYERARKHFEKKDLEKTVKELESSLKRAPELSEAHFLYAKVEYLQKRYPEALDRMTRAEATYESSRNAYLAAHAESQREVQRLRDRQDVVLANLRAQLSQAASGSQRSLIEAEIAEAEHARDEYERRLLEQPQVGTGMPADYHFFHGNVLLRLNRYDEAVARYRQALEANPAHADASNNLASIYLSARQPGAALEVLEKAEAAGATVNPELKRAVLAAQSR
ncbi:MAG: tetratricopeptide repeat protein [Acidobacteriota bacterium]